VVFGFFTCTAPAILKRRHNRSERIFDRFWGNYKIDFEAEKLYSFITDMWKMHNGYKFENLFLCSNYAERMPAGF
jgi:hypothetical protein